ncbi:MAG: metallophosphoesterase [Nitrospirae bacterium]|nr:MAG: metallophosphoesterase [Nitrospirota bacterium]
MGGSRHVLTRRGFLKLGSLGAAASLATARSGFAEAQSLPSLRVRRLALPALPEAWDGLTVVQISDVHAGPYMPAERMRRLRDVVNSLPADLVVFTGDQMDRRPDDAHRFAAGFAGTRARLGVFGILGNHDHYIAPKISEWALTAAGVRPLVNEAVTLTRRGEALHLVGLEDLSAGGGRRPRWELLDRREGFVLCLCHQPAGWPMARAAGAHLTLAGHTHGGQIAIPSRQVNVARLHSPYIAGLYREGNAALWVSRGVGVGAVPVRLGAPPEVDVLVLHRAAAAGRAVA